MKYYKHNDTAVLDEGLFRAPTMEYRGAPFWAWNSTLEPTVLCEQIDMFKEMGLGGFNMHVRQGLETPYLKKDFMDAVRACCEKAKREGMYAWAYDEDRWPSGCVGGALTVDMKYRLRYLLMTAHPIERYTVDMDEARNEGIPFYLGSFAVTVDEGGIMTAFDKVDTVENTDGIRHFYCMTKVDGEPRFNYQTYADTLSKEAMDRFIEMTHEVYKREVGEYFGDYMPAFFTDEPQLARMSFLNNGFSTEDVTMPFTLDFPETFRAECGYCILDRLPELFFGSATATAKKTRYDYYRHLTERFASAFADNIGEWCERNGVMLSGHALGEDTLYEQVLCGYESMRLYRKMQLPGMDCLFADKNFTAALQCRSAVNQYGRDAMLSELYGVTGWDFDFRGHKFHGDWQACLGVTVRCQHLAWQSMKGEGKRDYPASIFYQSPWYKEYKYVEDHFARLNTALTRGKSAVKVAVVHPLGTYWTERASVAETGKRCDELDCRFSALANWLITGMVDFDYLSESLLPELCPTGGAPLKVGEMSYDAVILQDCVTLSRHTVEILEAFKAAGGKLIFVGETPELCDAVASDRAKALTEGCEIVAHSKTAVRKALAPYTDVEVRGADGAKTEHFIHTERIDGDRRWLFLAHAVESELRQRSYGNELTVSIRGIYRPKVFDTVNGGDFVPSFEHKNGKTVIYTYLYDRDSLLLALDKAEAEVTSATVPADKMPFGEVRCPFMADYELSEPNVLLLDMAEYSLDGGDFQPVEEIMRIDGSVRKALGYIERKTKVVQPYVILDAPEDHLLSLRYTVKSEADFEGVSIALENVEKCAITLNGAVIPTVISGWYIDKDIKTVPLGTLVKGDNIITVTMPLGVRTDVEAAYLLGGFGVKCFGAQPVLYPLPEKMYFGDAGVQGLRFYGGNVTYKTEIEVESDCTLEIETSYYNGALVKVSVDGGEEQRIVYSPYRAVFDGVGKGRHTVEFTVFGNRFNTLSALHATVHEMYHLYNGPAYWRTEGDAFSYEYNFRPFGIIKTPVIRMLSDIPNGVRPKPAANYFFNRGLEWGKN